MTLTNLQNGEKHHQRYIWAAKAVHGKNVLYFGEHKALAPVKLASEGFQVTVTGIEKATHSELLNRIDKENEDVKTRLHFLHNDPFQEKESFEAYDSIITLDTIEYLTHPKEFLLKVWNQLKEDGQFIFSVPFGLKDHTEGQVSTFYITNTMGEIDPYFDVQTVEIVDHYLCLVAKKRPAYKKEDPPFYRKDWIEVLEQAFQKFEKEYLIEKTEQNQKIDAFELDLHTLKNEIMETKRSLQLLSSNQAMPQTFGMNIETEKRYKEEVIRYKNKEAQLKNEYRNYESLVTNALQQRDQNINFLRKRLTAVENSMKYRLGSVLHTAVRNPLKFPREFYKLARTTAGNVKRKIKGQKRNQKNKLVDLPFPNDPIPRSVLSNGVNLANLENQSDLNELFLMGRYDVPFTLKELRVACILDDFSYQSFKDDSYLITFRPDNWLEVLSKELPQLLFVESAWRGNSGSWQYKIAEYNTDQGSELSNLLEWCKKNNIPTVFWNKEDPIHFDKFIKTAKKFDYIYTTDENKIDSYKKEAGHNRVYALPFAAQPMLHNPIKVKNYKDKSVCFAGSYYSNRHEDRRKDQENLLDHAMEYGLEIYDRNYRNTESQDLQFPERFQPHIVGSMPYEQLVKAYKQYKVFLNVNSVQDSGTMFSRRVFELMGCGTTVLSTYAKGIQQMFGELVPMAEKPEELKGLFEKVMNNSTWRTQNELKAMRTIFNGHTYAHRLYQIAENIGMDLMEPYKKGIHAFAFIDKEEQFEQYTKMFFSQTYQYGKKLTFISLNQLSEAAIFNLPDVNLVTFNELEDFNDAFDELTYEDDFITILSDKHYYGNYYFEDLVHAFIYTDADAVGKLAHYELEDNQLVLKNEGREYEFSLTLLQDTLIMRKMALSKFGLLPSELLTNDYSIGEFSKYGMKMFASNQFNFVANGVSILRNAQIDLVDKITI